MRLQNKAAILTGCGSGIGEAVCNLLGDRYEILAAATVATIYKIPIAHIHGGEATEGLIDEAIRHSITKFSNYHLHHSIS